jgi:hypothetical protein
VGVNSIKPDRRTRKGRCKLRRSRLRRIPGCIQKPLPSSQSETYRSRNRNDGESKVTQVSDSTFRKLTNLTQYSIGNFRC